MDHRFSLSHLVGGQEKETYSMETEKYRIARGIICRKQLDFTSNFSGGPSGRLGAQMRTMSARQIAA